jgi:hypothetical protein
LASAPAKARCTLSSLHTVHPQTDRIDRLGGQSGDVRVAELPSQHGKGDRTQEVGQGGRVRTGEAQWTALDPMTEQAPVARNWLKKTS